MSSQRLPTYFLSHGGGPWPWMKDQIGDRYDRLEASLAKLRHSLGDAPRAVLVVTGHWEEPRFTVSSSDRPGMLYDYYGFPPHTYRITYPAPGSPTLAARVEALLNTGGIPSGHDAGRGFDHGTFSLMQPLYPEAERPVVQLSLLDGFDPNLHIKVGRLLAPLRDEGVLIIGSGSSYHNLRQWYSGSTEASHQFDAWLQQTLVHSDPAERERRLIAWESAPAARAAHPREEHLLPLMVAVGAAENEQGVCVYHQDDFNGSIALSAFRFGQSIT